MDLVVHLKEAVLGRASPRGAPGALDLVNVVAQGDEQVEEELGTAVEHLGLHGAATLEGGAAADDEGEVVGAKLGVGVGCVGVGIACGREDGIALNPGSCVHHCQIRGGACWLVGAVTNMTWHVNKLTEPLLAQSDALQVIQSVLVGSTVDDGILQQFGPGGLVENGGLVVALDLPGVAALVVDQPGRVVVLVQVLKDR